MVPLVVAGGAALAPRVLPLLNNIGSRVPAILKGGTQRAAPNLPVVRNPTQVATNQGVPTFVAGEGTIVGPSNALKLGAAGYGAAAGGSIYLGDQNSQDTSSKYSNSRNITIGDDGVPIVPTQAASAIVIDKGLAQMSKEDADRQYLADEQKYFGGPAPTTALADNTTNVPAQTVVAPAKPVSQLPGGSAEVIALQKQLNTKGAGLKEDGIYGPRTAEAVFASYNKEDPEVAAFNSGYKPEYKPGPLQNVTVDSVRRGDAPVPAQGLAARANGLDESTAYWLSGDAPEGYIPHASYEKFSDMFRRGR